MNAVLWLRRDLRRRDLPGPRRRRRRGRRRRRPRPVRDRPRALGPLRPGPTRLARRERPRRRGVLRRTAHRPRRRPGHEGRGVRRRRRGRLGARQRRDHAVRRGPRRPRTPTPRGAARSTWVATGSPYAVGPGRVRTQQGGPYRVFTPFSRAWREHGWADPAAAPRGVRLGEDASDDHAATRLDRALEECPVDLPTAGEDAALRRWRAFRDERLGDYADGRDRPGPPRHVPALAVPQGRRDPPAHDPGRARRRPVPGRQGLHRRARLARVLRRRAPRRPGLGLARPAARAALDEPTTTSPSCCGPGRRGGPASRSSTPGMRQLAETGWMHNRVRMITGQLPVQGPPRLVAARAPGTSSTTSSTATSPATTTAGSGSPAPAPTRRRTSGSSTRSPRARSSTPTATTSGAGSPSWPTSPGRKAHEPWTVEDGHEHGYPEPVVDHGEERAEALRRYEEARR